MHFKGLEMYLMKKPNESPLSVTTSQAMDKNKEELKIAIMEAHRECCQMINCVDCLFGVCRNDCEYQVEFKKKIECLLQ